jgi:prevent-host-death family protein
MVVDHGKLYFRGAIMAEEFDIIAISEFKATCLKILDQVKQTGNSIVVTKRGKPIAMISPPPPPKRTSSWLGSFKDKGKIVGDIVSPVVDENDWETLA